MLVDEREGEIECPAFERKCGFSADVLALDLARKTFEQHVAVRVAMAERRVRAEKD